MTTIRTDILCIEILDSLNRTNARINEVELCLSSLENKLSSLKQTKRMLEESFNKATDRDPNSIFGRQEK